MKKTILIILGITITMGAALLSPLPTNPNAQQWIFYDQEGEILFSEIPYYQPHSPNQKLQEYLIDTEDKNFYKHIGIDIAALARSTYYNLKNKKITSGASTITMQLARLLYLENHTRDWKYKLKQIFYALKLETKFSKKEILEKYLDHVYFGHNATGIDAAANLYFGKPTITLSTSQIATLISIIPRPDTWNPITNPTLAQERRNQVLQNLNTKKLITDQDYQLYSNQKITTSPQPNNTFRAPHFILWAKKQLQKHIPKTSHEIHVRTTLDGKKYTKILNTIRENIHESKLKNLTNMSVVALDLPENRLEIMLGAQDFFDNELDGEVNMTTARRETGSTLKPFLFALALENDMTPLTPIRDERQSFITETGSYSPRNFEPDREHGTVRFREALTNSYNIAAVDLLEKIGTEKFQNNLQQLNLQPPTTTTKDLSVILGTGETSLLNLTNAYATFPQKGQLQDIQFFTQVNDQNGNLILEWHDLRAQPKEIYQESTANWITHALSDNEARWWNFSQGNPLELPYQTAAKTGTSQDFRDNYVIGYSREKVVGVWAGNTDGTPMNTSSGIEGAGKTWHTIMQILHAQSPKNFTYNSNRTETPICKKPTQTYPNCAEQYIEFLLPNELNSAPTPTITQNRFSISYPGNGDIFHHDSPILIDVRNIPTNETVRYFFDNQEVEKLLRKLPPGTHTITAQTQTQKDEIQITISE